MSTTSKPNSPLPLPVCLTACVPSVCNDHRYDITTPTCHGRCIPTGFPAQNSFILEGAQCSCLCASCATSPSSWMNALIWPPIYATCAANSNSNCPPAPAAPAAPPAGSVSCTPPGMQCMPFTTEYFESAALLGQPGYEEIDEGFP